MRREECVKAIVRILARQGVKRYTLQHNVALRIREHQLVEPIAPLAAGAAYGKGRHAVVDRPDGAFGIALFLGKEPLSVGYDETEVSRAGLIDARMVNLIQNAMAQREPHPAARGECRAHATL